ncbi:MAG: hypothetical protein ABH951_01045 [Patescibacteria group bacterium]
MEKNKGFIGIGLIIAIIVGVLVVGGGAYYIGTKNDIVPENINMEENNLPQDNVVDKNTITNQQTKDEQASVPEKTTGPSSPCASTAQPSITILSPNGGETYTAGQQITIKWTSCNLPSTTPVDILLQAQFSSGPWFGPSGLATYGLQSTHTLNSGSTTITLPIQGSGQWYGSATDMTYGTYYKIWISEGTIIQGPGISDVSDNLFTIQTQKNPILTQTQAENLVLLNWGGCTLDTCGSVVVTVQQNTEGQYVVTAIYKELRDDSIGSQKKEAIVLYQNGVWVLGQPTLTWACQLNRGHQDFSTVFCI